MRAFDLVHAHFLYSDGAVALRTLRAAGVPYIVAVRNTDVNVFMRLRPDLFKRCCEIIDNAQRVIFITPTYVDLMLARLPESIGKGLQQKVCVVPNGLGQFWLRSAALSAPPSRDRLKLLYVGDFSRNKNIANTIRAAALLARERKVGLTLVGAGGDGEVKIERLLAGGAYPFVSRLGRIDDPVLDRKSVV